jgi:hypothetical protein
VTALDPAIAAHATGRLVRVTRRWRMVKSDWWQLWETDETGRRTLLAIVLLYMVIGDGKPELWSGEICVSPRLKYVHTLPELREWISACLGFGQTAPEHEPQTGEVK